MTCLRAGSAGVADDRRGVHRDDVGASRDDESRDAQWQRGGCPSGARHSRTDRRVTVGATAYGVVPDTVVAYPARVEKPDGDDAQRHPGRDEVERTVPRNPVTRPTLVRSGSLSKPPTDRRDSRSRTIWAVPPPWRSLPLRCPSVRWVRCCFGSSSPVSGTLRRGRIGRDGACRGCLPWFEGQGGSGCSAPSSLPKGAALLVLLGRCRAAAVTGRSWLESRIASWRGGSSCSTTCRMVAKIAPVLHDRSQDGGDGDRD